MAVTQRQRIVWEESYKLGIRGVDDDHFILVSMISQLEEAVPPLNSWTVDTT